MKKLFFTLFIFCMATHGGYAQKPIKIKPERKIHLSIPEPSDICLHPNGKSFFIVSDNGLLFETDLEGKVIRQADYKGLDSEGVYANDKYVFVAEEFSRKIQVFDIETLKVIRTVYLPYSGGRNKSYEAITYNKTKNKFVLLTEKDPIYLFELDDDLNITNQIDLGNFSRDVSAVTYYNNHIWFLGDEDMTVYKANPNTYEVISSWKLPIINPEGIAFTENGEMVILSDDMELLYYFPNPEK